MLTKREKTLIKLALNNKLTRLEKLSKKNQDLKLWESAKLTEQLISEYSEILEKLEKS